MAKSCDKVSGDKVAADKVSGHQAFGRQITRLARQSFGTFLDKVNQSKVFVPEVQLFQNVFDLPFAVSGHFGSGQLSSSNSLRVFLTAFLCTSLMLACFACKGRKFMTQSEAKACATPILKAHSTLQSL